VQTNLCPQLASWLKELDSLFPKELPFGTCRVGRSCFTAMAVTENYQSTPHTDKDLSNSVFSWFLGGECSLSILVVLDTVSFVEGKKNNCIPLYSYFFIVNLVGVGQEKWHPESNSCFQCTKCFFNPNKGLSYSFDLRGFNTTPCLSKGKDGNWVVHYTFRNKRCPNM
jgi:hypothetical protein